MTQSPNALLRFALRNGDVNEHDVMLGSNPKTVYPRCAPP
jgi:hypothetical protein